MLKSGTKLLVDTGSPWFWLLLVIPATALVMAYQYPEHMTNLHAGRPISQPIDKRFAVMHTAAIQAPGQAPLIRQASVSRAPVNDPGTAPSHTVAADIEADPAPLPAEEPTTAADHQGPATRRTAVQGSSKSLTGGVNLGGDAKGTASSAALSTPDLAGPPAAANLKSILDENPYLPVVDEDAVDPAMVDGSVSSPCPEVLFRGGNAYAILRLSQMGCEIPGS